MSDVVLDACVLFPASLRDTLLRAADADLYRVHLTADILEEVRRNLVKKGMEEQKSQRLINVIKEQFASGIVAHHSALIASMPNDEKDRHVLAAAVASKAQIVVTQNLKDFPQPLLDPFDVEAQSADEFLVNLFYLDTERMCQILLEQAKELRNPPKNVFEVLDTLSQHVPIFVTLIRQALRNSDLA